MSETPTTEVDARQALRERLYVALVEQRVLDSYKYAEAPYAPITWEDVDRVLPPEAGYGRALAYADDITDLMSDQPEDTPHPTDTDARALQDTQAEAGETGDGHGDAE